MVERDGERDGEGKKSFLKRWSRLKLEETERQPPAEAPIAAEVPPVEVPPVEVTPVEVTPVEVTPVEVTQDITEAGPLAETESTAGPEAEPEEPFDPADLPDIDSLDKDSDYTGFLKEGVPAQLRHMALQKLFRSDPALAVLDGLNDYDEDFTLAKVAEKIVSSYKPGRGYVDDDEEEDETVEIEDEDIETVVIEDEDTETVDIEDGDLEIGGIEDGDIETGDAKDTELADADETKKGRHKT